MAQKEKIIIFDAKEKEIGLSHEEIWDDTLLIQQWDSSMAKVRNRLDQRRATTTESEQSDPDRTTTSRGVGPGLAGAGNTGWRGSVESVGKRISNSKKKKKKNYKKQVDWQVGDFCRTRYTEDELWYEACITSLPPGFSPPRCWVRFLGYNNKQEMALEGLRKSDGEEARRRQIQEAEEVASESEVGSSVAESDRQSDTDGERTSKRHRPPSHHNNLPSMPPPPFPGASPFTAPGDLPVLPPPPALTQDPNSDPQTSQALHTMLMSWYMTGYHTGYYQGLSHAARK
ncbi:hypothetical protein Pmani_000717 [Petrolisthes manimaculis]|uniref:Tudor domain-containing protein n=1 Tax=Petrolisthes manimaculis TaxID=1843537 RepID=A0AAE1USQ8_9EUCA|nr:hypothetical protein Pmani_000717 [Petrolisthes manimaculis]